MTKEKPKGPLDHLSPEQQQRMVELLVKLKDTVKELGEAIEREARSKAVS